MLNYIPDNKIRAMTDLEFAAEVLQDRYDRMPNKKTLIAQRLMRSICMLRGLDKKSRIKPKNLWQIRFYDSSGERIPIDDMPSFQLERIGSSVSDGYANGPIKWQDD